MAYISETQDQQVSLQFAFNCSSSALPIIINVISEFNLICNWHRPLLSKARLSLLRLSHNARFLFPNAAFYNYSKLTRPRDVQTTYNPRFARVSISPRNVNRQQWKLLFVTTYMSIDHDDLFEPHNLFVSSYTLRKGRFDVFCSKLLVILTYLQLKKFNSHVWRSMGKLRKSMAHRQERASLQKLNSAELLMTRHRWLATVSSILLSFSFIDQYMYYFSGPNHWGTSSGNFNELP